jgi:hypothetical protein
MQKKKKNFLSFGMVIMENGTSKVYKFINQYKKYTEIIQKSVNEAFCEKILLSQNFSLIFYQTLIRALYSELFLSIDRPTICANQEVIAKINYQYINYHVLRMFLTLSVIFIYFV